MATFFGMTKLGSPNRFAASSRRPELEQEQHNLKRKAVTSVPVEALLDAFEAKASENESRTVRRALVPQIFEQVLGRKLEVVETELLLKHFDLKVGHMRVDEFQAGLQSLLDEDHPALRSTERPKTAGADHATFGRYSNLQLRDMTRKGTRNDFGPMDVLQYPITCNQIYGWHTEPSVVPKTPQKYFPHKSTEVTRSEGICLTSYYML